LSFLSEYAYEYPPFGGEYEYDFFREADIFAFLAPSAVKHLLPYSLPPKAAPVPGTRRLKTKKPPGKGRLFQSE
jgi:hypothetical protein